MTNLLAAVIVTISTNWTSIGTFISLSGAMEDVQQGQRVTNTTAILEWRGSRREFVLETATGPAVGERRVVQPYIAGFPMSRFATNAWPYIDTTNYWHGF
jgi:hypothetical protein